MRDWEEVRRARLEDGETLQSLSKRYGIPYSTLLNRAVKEDWAGETEGTGSAGPAELERVSLKMLLWIEKQLDGECADPKDIKSMTGALKDLKSLNGEKEEADVLTVSFEGEAEEMSL